MDIHRFEAIWIGVAVLLIFGLISTVAYGALVPGVKMVADEGGTIDIDAVKAGNFDQTDAFREPGVYQQSSDQYAVYVIAQQFLFNPGTSEPIEVPAESTVTFHITSSDVMHGFEVAGTNLNVMVIPGQVTQVTVEFSEPASYGIVCNEYCGAAHHTMEGQLEVIPRNEFNGSEV